jgi:auxin influx carrier (AUX1 LAX family)
MTSEKVETVVAGNYLEMEREEEGSKSTTGKLSKFFWHGGSVYDAWFSCASNQALIHKSFFTSLIMQYLFLLE